MVRFAILSSVWMSVAWLSGIGAAAELPLVPTPVSIDLSTGDAFELNARSRILFGTRSAPRPIETTLEPLAHVLAGELELVTGMRPQVLGLGERVRPRPGDVLLRFQSLKGSFAETEPEEDQAYRLDVGARGVVVESAYYKGVCYGTATLVQSLRIVAGQVLVPGMNVQDQAEAEYRSVMIDVARRPHSIEVLKDVVRLARLYKLRYIQLHLTDNESFTYPFEPIVGKLGEKNDHFTRGQLTDLVAYADARGVTLIPELDLPGHSAKLRASGYLDPGESDADVADPENHGRIHALIDDMLGVFKSSPYFHIGGDESGAGSKLVPFLRSVNEHLRGNPAGGKRRLIVWEGFHGKPTRELPAKGDDRIIVMAWESSYNAPWDLLEAGYEVINASWKPLYLAGGGGFAHPGSTGGKKFRVEDLQRWSKSVFMHWEPGRPIYEDRGPKDPDKDDGEWDARWIGKDDRILGAQMQFWEQEESSVMIRLPKRLATMADRLWNPLEKEEFAGYLERSSEVAERVMTIVQPVEILPPALSERIPITDFYQPYRGDSVAVDLRNRSRVPGTIRFTESKFSSQFGWIGFSRAELPGSSSLEAKGAMEKSGGFGICARLFRRDGTPVDGVSWKFFNNWPDRVRMVDYDIGRHTPSEVIDLASLPEDKIKRRYDMPLIRGPVQHVEITGQMLTSVLTLPDGGELEFGMKTQNGRANFYLDLNLDGRWDRSEIVIENTPPSEETRTGKARLEAGKAYPLRIDHVTGMPRPVLGLFLVEPETGKRREITEFLSLPGA